MNLERGSRGPMAAGAALALAAAVAFGASAPLVQQLGRGAGAFATAALLYAGAGASSVGWVRRGVPDRLRSADAPRLAVVAALGAVVGPVALAWGLQRTNGVAASLLLNLEALFTVVLARVLWAEPVGPRVGVALVLMTAGGGVLVARGGDVSTGSVVGALAIVLATAAWAGDNTVGRPLADRESAQVVLGKAAIGAAASACIAGMAGERWPAVGASLGLAASGAVGYGLSLRFYLQAQRVLGAARTGSIFACAPFAGAAIAWALGQRAAGGAVLGGAVLCALGVWLHLTEHHSHPHTHDAFEHEHAHAHDDPHHAHPHDPPPMGPHSHAHVHGSLTHEHPHGLDVHHRHRH
jgi:drug/metabolite transporter (DMT)-like permease